MKLKNNTIIITGGSSGIGLEIAKQLEETNKIIICSRSQKKLDAAKSEIPSVSTFQCDISKKDDCEKFYIWVEENFPECNILINNAAIVNNTDFLSDNDIIDKAISEVKTNFLGAFSLSKLFIPLILKNDAAKIIFISTGLVYAPKVAYPVYCPTKAALHSFTKILKYKLKDSAISVVEVIMTVVDTPFHMGNAPKMAISTQKAVKEMITKLNKGKTTIRIGKTKLLYFISRFSPSLALKLINKVE